MRIQHFVFRQSACVCCLLPSGFFLLLYLCVLVYSFCCYVFYCLPHCFSCIVSSVISIAFLLQYTFFLLQVLVLATVFIICSCFCVLPSFFFPHILSLVSLLICLLYVIFSFLFDNIIHSQMSTAPPSAMISCLYYVLVVMYVLSFSLLRPFIFVYFVMLPPLYVEVFLLLLLYLCWSLPVPFAFNVRRYSFMLVLHLFYYLRFRAPPLVCLPFMIICISVVCATFLRSSIRSYLCSSL